MEIKQIKENLFNSQDLSLDETIYVFDLIMSGRLSEIDITAILIGLKLKTESQNEILGAVKIMRSKSLKIQSDDQTVDTCGTGGDMIGTLNISTSSAIVAASAGVKIAKHGNRSISSKSGSADMLEKIGYKISNDLKILNWLSNTSPKDLAKLANILFAAKKKSKIANKILNEGVNEIEKILEYILSKKIIKKIYFTGGLSNLYAPYIKSKFAKHLVYNSVNPLLGALLISKKKFPIEKLVNNKRIYL